MERLRLPRGDLERARRSAASRRPRTRWSAAACSSTSRATRASRSLDDGYGITCEDLNNTAEAQGVTIKRGDYVIVRTGQMERCQKAGSWDGYPGGDAPGFAFETLEWVSRTQLAALASDTWGCEVRPNETEPGINQPWHWITIPIMGMTMGEIFYVKDLADDCAADKVYEFMFVAPAIPITGAVGSPTNPLAIK